MDTAKWLRGNGYGTVATGQWLLRNGHGAMASVLWLRDNGYGDVYIIVQKTKLLYRTHVDIIFVLDPSCISQPSGPGNNSRTRPTFQQPRNWLLTTVNTKAFDLRLGMALCQHFSQHFRSKSVWDWSCLHFLLYISVLSKMAVMRFSSSALGSEQVLTVAGHRDCPNWLSSLFHSGSSEPLSSLSAAQHQSRHGLHGWISLHSSHIEPLAPIRLTC